jgi:serine/threonine protein kinase
VDIVITYVVNIWVAPSNQIRGGLKMKDRSGQQLGNYILIRKLGQGGFGEVWLGEHVHLKTQAALKLLHQVQLPSDEEQKFCKEAAIIAKLEHPNIIRVLDYGIQESKSEPFLVMEYAPKGSLRQLYPRGKILSPHHILFYVNQVASALQYAHEHKVIHCDIKPENMLLDESNKIRLSDFGIAVVYGTTPPPKTMDKLGTPSYMAPEQFRGKPLPASDQYSLGIVVYGWLCGTLPFHGQLGELFHQHEKALIPTHDLGYE